MLDVFTVAFFGHRYIDYYRPVEEQVSKIIRTLIKEHEYVDFLVGRDGEFDQIVASEVRKIKHEVYNGNSSLIWVMPYVNAEYIQNKESFESYYDEVEICSESYSAYPKAAIQKRNRSMVDRSDLVFFYVTHPSGGAYQTMRYARRIGKKIINIADIIDGIIQL